MAGGGAVPVHNVKSTLRAGGGGGSGGSCGGGSGLGGDGGAGGGDGGSEGGGAQPVTSSCSASPGGAQVSRKLLPLLPWLYCSSNE